MDFFKGQEIVLNDSSPEESIQVIKELDSSGATLASGKKLSIKELHNLAKPIEEAAPPKPIKENKGVPYDDQPYGGLKKLGESKEPSTSEAKSDGKPYIPKSKSAPGGVINLKDELEEVENRKRRLEKKVKNKKKLPNSTSIPVSDKTLEGVEPAVETYQNFPNKTPTSQTNTSAPMTADKAITLQNLLKHKGKQDKYKESEFDITVKVKLPPKDVLRNIEEFFDLPVVEEVGEMIKSAVQDQIKSEEFTEYIQSKVDKYLNDSNENEVQ